MTEQQCKVIAWLLSPQAAGCRISALEQDAIAALWELAQPLLAHLITKVELIETK